MYAISMMGTFIYQTENVISRTIKVLTTIV